MLETGVQTQNVVRDENPYEGFGMLRRAGFTCADFSLNGYLDSRELYRSEVNGFFDRTDEELERYFTPHKRAAQETGIRISQMHMPYPVYVPGGKREVNEYLRDTVGPKSLRICAYLGCRYLVVHGIKVSKYVGSEEAEWERTEAYLERLAPEAGELGITLCMENLYESRGGHVVEGPCCDARKAAERIDRMNEKYGAEVLGFCFDTGHANLVGLDGERFMEVLGERLKVFHIHDNDGRSDLHQIPYTFSRSRGGMASTDWEGFVRGLRRLRGERVLSFETAPVLKAFPEELKEETLRFIAGIGRYFAERVEET